MLIWSRPAADELARGHLDRQAVLNGISDRRRLDGAIERWQLDHCGSEQSAVGAFGFVTAFGQDPGDYAKNHAWLASDHALKVDGSGYNSFRKLPLPPEKRPLAPRLWRNQFFCVKCALEEQATLAFSYWHRIHQYPGIIHCERHGVALSYVPVSKKPSLPHHHMHHAKQVDVHLAEDVLDHPIGSRYYRIARQLLNLDFRVRLCSAGHLLLARCRELGIFEPGRHWCVGLRRMALAELPGLWITECFDGDLHRVASSYERHHHSLSHPEWAMLNLKEYTLALAVLYETPEQALDFVNW